SLLSLQARYAESADSAQTYAVIQARLAALMHVHRWVYDDATSNGVDLAALAGELGAGLGTGLVSPAHSVVSVSCDIAPIVLHPDAAVPTAFLITELASLAALHGTPGPLAVQITASGDNRLICLAVASAGFIGDNPIAATNLSPTARIIHGMARQLRSALVYDDVAGRYSLTFTGLAL
ncbi:MAG: hypothetical protein H7267_10045, partial [Sandarakinorhabdus sp.]|nr:hypothetical protein [Sandarakinorhabdus sp.]